MTETASTPSRRFRQRAPVVPGEIRIVGMVIIMAVLCLTMMGPYINYKPAPFTGEGNPFRQLIYVTCALAALVAARPLHKPGRLIVLPLVIILALGWCWLSIAWSVAPEITVRRIALTTIILWTIFLTTRQAGYDWSVNGTRTVLVGFLLANYVAAVIFPSFGVHQAYDIRDPGLLGAWRGVMNQKNYAGAVCAYTVLYFLFDTKRMNQFLRFAVMAGGLYFLYRTHSKTSMGILAFSALCGWIFIRYNPAYRRLLIPVLSLVAAGLFFAAMLNWETLSAPFSDPYAFTSRVHIWTTVMKFANDHWLFGSGYGAFWNLGGLSPIYQYTRDWVSEITAAHNGYVDLLIQVGMPGMLLAILATLIWPIGLLLSSKVISRQSGALLLSMIIFSAGHNLTETSLLQRDEPVQVFLTLALALTWLQTKRAKSLPSPKQLPVEHGRSPEKRWQFAHARDETISTETLTHERV